MSKEPTPTTQPHEVQEVQEFPSPCSPNVPGVLCSPRVPEFMKSKCPRSSMQSKSPRALSPRSPSSPGPRSPRSPSVHATGACNRVHTMQISLALSHSISASLSLPRSLPSQSLLPSASTRPRFTSLRLQRKLTRELCCHEKDAYGKVVSTSLLLPSGDFSGTIVHELLSWQHHPTHNFSIGNPNLIAAATSHAT